MGKHQIIFLVLGGIATIEFILFIVYITKYYSLKSDYSKLSSNYSDLKIKNICNNNNNNSNSIEDILSPSPILTPTVLNMNNSNIITYKDINEIINSYDIYRNMDFYDKYDLLDQFGEKIAIFSPNLNNCYLTCEILSNCYGFARYHNYCYLKNKYDLFNKSEIMNVDLVIKQNKLNDTINSKLLYDNKSYSELNNESITLHFI